MESENATVLYVRTVDALTPERNDATVSPTPSTHLPVPSETFSPMPLTHLLETSPSDTAPSLFPLLMLTALHEKSMPALLEKS